VTDRLEKGAATSQIDARALLFKRDRDRDRDRDHVLHASIGIGIGTMCCMHRSGIGIGIGIWIGHRDRDRDPHDRDRDRDRAWVLHMVPWLASMHGSSTWAPGLGPAQGPWARVLHKGQGPGLQTLLLMRLMDMHHVIELHAFRLDQLKTRSPS
jgi:hypothetical protein